MKKFCIVTNLEKDKEYALARHLKSLLEERGCECILVRDRFMDDKPEGYID